MSNPYIRVHVYEERGRITKSNVASCGRNHGSVVSNQADSFETENNILTQCFRSDYDAHVNNEQTFHKDSIS